MAKHTVKVHKWVNGILHWTEHVFGSKHDCDQFLKHSDHHHAKVYNSAGNIIHEDVKQPVADNTTYA